MTTNNKTLKNEIETLGMSDSLWYAIFPTNNKTLKNEIETSWWFRFLHRPLVTLRIIRLSRMRLKRTPRDRPITIQSTTNNKTLKNEIETKQSSPLSL